MTDTAHRYYDFCFRNNIAPIGNNCKEARRKKAPCHAGQGAELLSESGHNLRTRTAFRRATLSKTV